jgi:hypothetical protein
VSRSVFFFLISFLCQSILAQSPHGKNFAIDCATCHHPENWSYQQNKSTFSHDSTSFPLIGQHRDLDCRSCHQTLEFKKVESTCIACHTDVHQQTVGNDCARCHTPQSWIVENITQLHEQTSFPLMGVHATIDCNACHQSESNSRYSPTGVTCIDCHRSDYVNTQKPNHIKNNFGNDCAACHGVNGSGWNTDIVDHSFFPLEQGHQIADCKACHLAEDYSIISPNCISCHQQDYDNTLVPNHKNAGFSTQCTDCHTLAVGWKPVNFAEHDGRFFLSTQENTKAFGQIVMNAIQILMIFQHLRVSPVTSIQKLTMFTMEFQDINIKTMPAWLVTLQEMRIWHSIMTIPNFH